MILRKNIDKFKSILEPDTIDLKKESNKYYDETPSNILFRGDSFLQINF